MKFKYKGRDGMRDFNLAIEGVLPMEETLTKGQVVDIPKDHKLVSRLRQNGLWEELPDKPKESTKNSKKAKTKGGE